MPYIYTCFPLLKYNNFNGLIALNERPVSGESDFFKHLIILLIFQGESSIEKTSIRMEDFVQNMNYDKLRQNVKNKMLKTKLRCFIVFYKIMHIYYLEMNGFKFNIK